MEYMGCRDLNFLFVLFFLALSSSGVLKVPASGSREKLSIKNVLKSLSVPHVRSGPDPLQTKLSFSAEVPTAQISDKSRSSYCRSFRVEGGW